MWLERGLPCATTIIKKNSRRVLRWRWSRKTVRRSSDWFCHWSEWTGFLQHATEASEYTLILLLFLVGISCAIMA